MHQSSCYKASSDASAPLRLRANGFEPPPCVLRVPLRVLSTLMRVVYFSASATGPHDLLHEDALVDFLAVVPRLDDVEPDVDFFAAGRGRVGDESLDVDFFAAGRGWLDVVAVGTGFFAGLLAGGWGGGPRGGAG